MSDVTENKEPSLFERTKLRMQDLGIEPKKALGQNFLVSDNVVRKIIQAVESFQAEQLIEVGPGLGALTDQLRKINTNLNLIELDRHFAAYWRAQGLNVTEEDALRVSFESLINKRPVVFVSNLPYQISSSIVIERTLDTDRVDGMVLMFQKEVAQKINSKPGSNYGMLSMFAQTFWDISLLQEAGPGDFFPPPKVASRVLVFRKKANVDIPAKKFLNFLKAGFQQPRKKLLTNLEHGLHREKAQIQSVFADLNHSENTRGEELTVVQMQNLFRHIDALK